MKGSLPVRVCVLNGNPDVSNSAFDSYLARVEKMATVQGHSVRVLPLRDMDISYCTGCFGCWVKTPGECVVKDESAEVCRAVLHSDLVIFASPAKMGFISALLKKAHDKLIPLLLPYFTIRGGECHHPLRYGRSPDVAVLLERNGADDEDIAIIERSYRRLVMNLDSEFRFLKLTDEPVEEVIDAIGSL